MFARVLHFLNVLSDPVSSSETVPINAVKSLAAPIGSIRVTKSNERKSFNNSPSRRNSLSNDAEEISDFDALFLDEEENDLENLSREQLTEYLTIQKEKLYLAKHYHTAIKRELKETREHLQSSIQYLIEFEQSEKARHTLEEEKSVLNDNQTELKKEAFATHESLIAISRDNAALQSENSILKLTNKDALKEIAVLQKEIKKRDWVKWACGFFIVVGLALCCTGIGAAVGAPILAAVTTVLSVVGAGAGAGGAGLLVIGSAGVLAYRAHKQSTRIEAVLANVQSKLPNDRLENVVPSVSSQATTLKQLKQQPELLTQVSVSTFAVNSNKATTSKSSLLSCLFCCFWSSPPVAAQSVSNIPQNNNQSNPQF